MSMNNDGAGWQELLNRVSQVTGLDARYDSEDMIEWVTRVMESEDEGERARR